VVDVENGVDNIIGGPATNFQVDPVPPAHMGFTSTEVAEDANSILDGVTTNAPVIADGRPSTVRIRLADNTRASLDAIQSTVFNRSTGYLAALREAMLLAAQRRLRPILMTAVAAIFGMLPLAFAFGAGSQMLQPPAIAVIGGLLLSMLLSLTVTPIVYYLLTCNGPIHRSTQAV
jgi:multidrug efflux pump subunit AcrB